MDKIFFIFPPVMVQPALMGLFRLTGSLGSEVKVT